MRLLHVSDWHLGRTHGQTERREDLADVLEQTVGLARDFKPDLVIHSGDLFDGPRPAVDDLQLACDTLRQLGESSPVVVIAGNHDSQHLFRFLDSFLYPGRVHFADVVKRPEDRGVLDFEISSEQRIRLASVPFISAHRMVKAFEDPVSWTAAYADRVRNIIGLLAKGLTDGHQADRDILLFAAHLHVEGAIVTNSERPYTVSEGYATHASALPPVTYAAFGHIHRAQKLPQASVTGYYAGSPIPLDFGEEHDAKVCVLVEADPGRAPKIIEHSYAIARPLRRFEGPLEDLPRLCAEAGKCLAQVIVHTDEPAQELAAQVKALLPDAVLLDVIEVCAAQQQLALTASDVTIEAEVPIPELFSEYISDTGVHASTVSDVLETFRMLHDAGDEPPDLPELITEVEPPTEVAAIP